RARSASWGILHRWVFYYPFDVMALPQAQLLSSAVPPGVLPLLLRIGATPSDGTSRMTVRLFARSARLARRASLSRFLRASLKAYTEVTSSTACISQKMRKREVGLSAAEYRTLASRKRRSTHWTPGGL